MSRNLRGTYWLTRAKADAGSLYQISRDDLSHLHLQSQGPDAVQRTGTETACGACSVGSLNPALPEWDGILLQ